MTFFINNNFGNTFATYENFSFSNDFHIMSFPRFSFTNDIFNFGSNEQYWVYEFKGNNLSDSLPNPTKFKF